MRKLPADCEENTRDEYCERQRVAWPGASQNLADKEILEKYKWQRKVFPQRHSEGDSCDIKPLKLFD